MRFSEKQYSPLELFIKLSRLVTEETLKLSLSSNAVVPETRTGIGGI
jgi:hypothetical protein